MIEWIYVARHTLFCVNPSHSGTYLLTKTVTLFPFSHKRAEDVERKPSSSPKEPVDPEGGESQEDRCQNTPHDGLVGQGQYAG